MECGKKKDCIIGYTLEIDASEIETTKYKALRTYLGYRGCIPIVGHIALFPMNNLTSSSKKVYTKFFLNQSKIMEIC